MVQMHSDAALSSTGALLMKTVIKNNRQEQMVHFRFDRIRLPDTCESALKVEMSSTFPTVPIKLNNSQL